MKQEKNIVEPGFPVAMYELEKALKEGWQISQEREPIYIAGLYDIILVKYVAVEEFTNKSDLKVVENDNSEEKVIENNNILSTQEPVKRGPKPKK